MKGFDPETAAAIKKKIPEWRADARAFVRQVFMGEADSLDVWQDAALAALSSGEHKRICLKACKGVGKTAFLAWAGLWALFCHQNMQIVAMAVTEANLTDGLWKELHFWAHKTEKSRLLFGTSFDFAKTRISHVDPNHSETWWISARSFPKAATPEDCGKSLYGLHAENMMILLDESGGMPEAVMDAAEGILFNDGGMKRIVQAGNPSHRSGPLWNACMKTPQQWWIRSITAAPDAVERSTRVPRQAALDYIARHGGDLNDDRVKVDILGQFPDQDMAGMFDDEVLREAGEYYLPDDAFKDMAKILGVDVARQGEDSTVLFPRQGRVGFQPVVLQGCDTLAVVAAIERAARTWEPDAIVVDGTGGYGGGVIDILKSKGYPVYEVLFNESKNVDKRFMNRRAEMYYKTAQWFKNPVACWMDPKLREELMASTYYHKGDKLAITPKEQIKKELGRSPDYADALALTFAVEVASSARRAGPVQTYRKMDLRL